MMCTGFISFLVYLSILHKQVDSCHPGYWLSKGNHCNLCPTNCEQCRNSTHCTQCKPGFWDIRPSFVCGSPCRETCTSSGCDETTGHCFECHPGSYGKYCERNCSLCLNRNCGREKCTLGCIDGYYEDTESDSQCRKCNRNCTLCNSLTKCLRCQRGFFLVRYRSNNFTFCERCPSNCVECNSSYECTVCRPGRYGPDCSKECSISNCNQCTEVESVAQCMQCSNGYTLQDRDCVLGINVCSQFCSTECDSNGKCLGDCSQGWTGPKCTERCADRCRKCDQNDGSKCEICEGDYYTATCNTPCSPNCSAVFETVTCNINNGTCLNECEDGYWGDKCDNACYEGCQSVSCDRHNGFCDTCHRQYYGAACQNSCSKQCVDDNDSLKICYKRNGTCVHGCQDGYSGDTCEDDLPSNNILSPSTVPAFPSTTKNEITGITESVVEKDQLGVIAIGSGAGGGLIVVISFIILVVCVVKRKQRKGDNSQGEGIGHVNSQHSLPESDNLYATPNKPRKEQSQDYIYAQPNKPKKSIHHSKKEISVPQRTYDNVIIDLDTEGDRSEEINSDRIASGEANLEDTDIDIILLENIDDDPKSIIVTEVNVPASDTYYNMAGLVRSRIQISNLFEYVKTKTDFENEFEKLPKGLTRTCNEALKPHNRVKNRYNGIYAYDATRVVLRSGNFINANYVDDQGQSDISYFASLGPTKIAMNNFATFWEMAWQENSNKIIMLTNLEETKKMKCEQYWPSRGSQNTYGDFTVTSVAGKVFSDFVVREFTLEQNSKSRNVTQYHYTAWPDKTVPHTVSSLIEFRDKVEQGNTPITGPIIVHCSAGIGRTGTYIALDILIREGKEENFVDIFGCVIGLRGQRVNLVQNVEQYIFLHHCVLYALTCDPDTLPATAIPHVFTDEKIETQYQSLLNLTLLRSKVKRPFVQAKSRKENRKGADNPDDEHRVRLTLTKHDYINAVYVNGYEETNKFILAQTPLPNTVEDFVSMIYQESCSYIVCLDEENIKDKTVAQYIPPANKVSMFGHFQVSCTRSDPKEDFIFRELKISRIGSPPAKELTVRHYQFKGWNISDTVPNTVTSFLNIIQEVERARKSSHSKQPIVVHCLTGSERSGLFCVVSVLLEKMAVEKELSVLNTICQVRSRRRSAVKDIEQLRFCYNCVEEMLEMPDTNTYYNISSV